MGKGQQKKSGAPPAQQGQTFTVVKVGTNMDGLTPLDASDPNLPAHPVGSGWWFYRAHDGLVWLPMAPPPGMAAPTPGVYRAQPQRPQQGLVPYGMPQAFQQQGGPWQSQPPQGVTRRQARRQALKDGARRATAVGAAQGAQVLQGRANMAAQGLRPDGTKRTPSKKSKKRVKRSWGDAWNIWFRTDCTTIVSLLLVAGPAALVDDAVGFVPDDLYTAFVWPVIIGRQLYLVYRIRSGKRHPDAVAGK